MLMLSGRRPAKTSAPHPAGRGSKQVTQPTPVYPVLLHAEQQGVDGIGVWVGKWVCS